MGELPARGTDPGRASRPLRTPRCCSPARRPSRSATRPAARRRALGAVPAAHVVEPDARRHHAVLPRGADDRRRRARVLRDHGRRLRPGARPDRGALETAEDQRAKLAFLAEASDELSSSLDYEATLKKVAWLAVPDVRGLVRDHSSRTGACTALAVAHVDPDKVQLAPELQERYPADPDAPRGGWQVLRTGESRADPGDHRRDAGRRRPGRGAPADRPRRSTCAAPSWSPLIAHEPGARGDHLGRGGVRPAATTEDDVEFAEDIARRAAVAIDNALLHSETLADRRPAPAGGAARPRCRTSTAGSWRSYYDPSGRTDVGGDFYDAIPPGRRPAGAVRRRRDGPWGRGGRGDGADAGRAPGLHRRRPGPRRR